MVGVRDEDYVRVVQWMIHVLDHCAIDHRDETPRYDNQSHYDHAFYTITGTARDFWSPRLGYVPTDECLFRAFFDAEKRRLEGEHRQRRESLLAGLGRWFRTAHW